MITDPDIIADMKRYVKLNKEYRDLEVLDQTYKNYSNLLSNLKNAKDLLANEADEEMREMAKMEIDELEQKRPQLEEDIKFMLIPKDPEDDKNAIIELRAGTGGDEACIFVEDKFKSIIIFCESNFKFTVFIFFSYISISARPRIIFPFLSNTVV